MIIAIASDGKDKGSLVSDQPGRAPYFQLVDNGEVVEVVSNPFAIGGGGAGLAVARMLHQKKVGEVVAGQIGGNMAEALDELGIKYRMAQGKVEDCI
jgi:predicted Fe-Mo cluster-binding NifX family protein